MVKGSFPRSTTGISVVGAGILNITDSYVEADNPVVAVGASSVNVTRSTIIASLREDQIESLRAAVLKADPGKEELALKKSPVGRWLSGQSFTDWAALAIALAAQMPR